MSNQDSERDLQSALASNLRLHPQRMELGQAEMLTDALLNKFDDLEQRLNTYILGASDGENLRKGMQSYLSRLNANPLIPLHFRLKVLKRFEGHLALFDAEMTAAILNAHKIGIDMVQKEAQAQPEYYPILVGMISQAIELAGRLMRQGLAEYQSAAIITVRQVFDLIRLGMVILPELPPGADSERKRLNLAITRYELLRNLDFFSLTPEGQGLVMDELKNHIQILKPYYLAKGAVKSADVKGYSLLATNLGRPHTTAKVVPFAPDSTASDHLLVPMDDFIDKLVMSIDRAEKVLKDPLLQSKNLQMETSLQTTIVGGNAILDALRTKSRISERQEYGNAKLTVDWGVAALIAVAIEEGSGKALQTAGPDKIKHFDSGTWSVLNISKQGLAIERMGSDAPEGGVGNMVGLNWKPHRGEPRFAFIKWIRYPKPGEQQVGLKFYLRESRPILATMLSIGDSKNIRHWPVLVTFEKDGDHIVVFPDNTVFKGLVFSIKDNQQGGYYKVAHVQEVGANYAICIVQVASELDTTSIDG